MSKWIEDGYFMSARHIVLYPHCNYTKNLFGGQMLSWIDLAAALYASCQMQTKRIVTAKMEEINFAVPAELGSIITLYCKTAHAGNSSLKVNVIVTKRDHTPESERVVIDTNLVFVSLSEEGKPTPWKKN